jgi:hypothetical protein
MLGAYALLDPDIDVFDRVKAPSQRGTEGSNLASSLEAG